MCQYIEAQFRYSEFMTYFEVFILSLVEGLTEYLPISSTGHLILTSAWFGISEEGFVKNFNIIIQFGAILAVLVLYWQRFKLNIPFYRKLLVAFVPAALFGLAVKSHIDLILGDVRVVAWALIIGGVVLIASDWWFKSNEGPEGKGVDQLSLKDCLIIGILQCLAFIPGVSRAAASILASQSRGLSKKEATEFSFFLAVPTLTAAAGLKTLGIAQTLQGDQLGLLLLGLLLSFLFALLAIQFLISIVNRIGFKYFGFYRVALGLLVLLFI